MLFLGGYFLLQLGKPFLYDLWGHLGSGSLEYEGKLFPFGDLVHVTAAAKCSNGLEIGVNSCDPWQRAFNQNPDFIHLLQFIRLTNVDLLGIGSYVLLTLLLVLIAQRQNLTNIGFIIFIVSPPFILAVDRGNEIITTSLILLSFVTLESRNKYIKIFSIFFLFAAVFFKLWPLLLVALLTLFGNRSNKKYLLSAFILSAGYWASNIHEIPKMLSATQNGSPYGVSFGLNLFFSDQISPIHVRYLVTLAIVIAAAWIYSFSHSLFVSIKSLVLDGRLAILIPILLTYVGIWILSDSFIYRMLILLPALMIVISKDLLDQPWVKALTILILVTVLTSRLAVTTAISSSLALVFLFVSCTYAWIRISNHIRQRQVSEEVTFEDR